MPTVALLLVGTDFHHTALTHLERFEAGRERVIEALQRMPSLDGHVVLSTCNRVEIYAESTAPERARDEIVAVLARELGLVPDAADAELSVCHDADAARHLFAVACGLESMIIGDEEISGQTRHALHRALAEGTDSPDLVRLFRHAATVSRTVRRRTGLGGTGRSIMGTALTRAETNRAAGERSALIIGTGAYARVAAAAVASWGATTMHVYSRSGRAPSFGARHDALPVARADLATIMSEVDVVVCASGTPGYAIDAEVAREARHRRPHDRDLTILDVSLARDVAPEVALLNGIHVITLDDIRRIAPVEYDEPVAAARAIVEAAAVEFDAHRAARECDAAVVALRTHVERRVATEIESVRRRRGDAAADEVRASLRRVTGALLHGPSTRARQFVRDGNPSEFARAVQVLFDIEVGG